MKSLIAFILITAGGLTRLEAQSYINGKVMDDSNQVVKNVSISYSQSKEIYKTDSAGYFSIPYIPGSKNSITFSHIGYTSKTFQIPKLYDNENYELKIILKSEGYTFQTVNAQGKKSDDKGIILQIKPLNTGPSVSGDFLDIIKTLPGVSSNNELSSQYNVRGGSYDENLIYVNDMEIFRPQLIRSGQQEGLSFINGDLVSNLSFSAGGFEAKYGDKLSSALDVTYRTPRKFGAGFQIGLLGGSVFVEGIQKGKERGRNDREFTKFTYLIGARYRANRNILNSLDVQGNYKSRFADFQSLFAYHLNREHRVELLINVAENKYTSQPIYAETTFGTLQNALRLHMDFAGQEIMNYSSAMSGLSYIIAKKRIELKFMATGFVSQESEHYDIQGQYRIEEVDNNLGSSSLGSAKSLLGLGYFINSARNDLYYTIANIAHQGTKKIIVNGHTTRLLWGLKYERANIHDKFKEWKFSDSSGYNVVRASQNNNLLELSSYITSKIDLINSKATAFLQYQKGFGQYDQVNLTVGVRYLYSELNGQHLFSPRAQLYYEPNRAYNVRHKTDSIKKNNILLRLAGGYYYQPPFYREMRNFEGAINPNLKAQRSIHGVAGAEFPFRKWGRPFKFMVEGYYQQLDYLVPYLLDNIRIRYYATNTSRGYATGIDTRLNGEFIKGLESWISLSVLKTDEKITYISNGDTILSPYLRRPTDRRVSAAIMFQDELNKNPDYRVHLMFNYGSSLPYYLGGDARYKEGLAVPSYKRVDIGFSKVLIGGKSVKQRAYAEKHKDKNHLELLWIGVDVFNLFQINNVISYIWVKDFNNTTYGVPNYLSGRRLNVRLVGKF